MIYVLPPEKLNRLSTPKHDHVRLVRQAAHGQRERGIALEQLTAIGLGLGLIVAQHVDLASARSAMSANAGDTQAMLLATTTRPAT
jgi:hypothetical protein